MSMLDKVRSDALGVLEIGPRALGQALEDLRRIADGMETLPRLLEVLASIDAKVDELNREVKQMRGGVESLDGKVDELTHSLSPLRGIARRSRRRAEADREAS